MHSANHRLNHCGDTTGLTMKKSSDNFAILVLAIGILLMFGACAASAAQIKKPISADSLSGGVKTPHAETAAEEIEILLSAQEERESQYSAICPQRFKITIHPMSYFGQWKRNLEARNAPHSEWVLFYTALNTEIAEQNSYLNQ